MAREPGSPSCECHDETMYWHKDPRYLAGGFWYCSVKTLERHRKDYAQWDGVKYNLRLLQHRRHKALARRRRKEASSG